MAASLARHAELTEHAAAAYRRARMLVYDRLAPGEPVIDGRLSAVQREAITELLVAEADLADYRRDWHDSEGSDALGSWDDTMRAIDLTTPR